MGIPSNVSQRARDIFTFPGAMIPGQFGPISRDFVCRERACFTFTMSFCGIPSVMQTIKGTSASKASKIAAAAPGGGTYITLASAFTLSIAYKSRIALYFTMHLFLQAI